MEIGRAQIVVIMTMVEVMTKIVRGRMPMIIMRTIVVVVALACPCMEYPRADEIDDEADNSDEDRLGEADRDRCREP